VLVVDLFVNGKYCVSRADGCKLQVEGRLTATEERYVMNSLMILRHATKVKLY
jgi:hypothetical protein